MWLFAVGFANLESAIPTFNSLKKSSPLFSQHVAELDAPYDYLNAQFESMGHSSLKLGSRSPSYFQSPKLREVTTLMSFLHLRRCYW
jgi:hypothetical protein